MTLVLRGADGLPMSTARQDPLGRIGINNNGIPVINYNTNQYFDPSSSGVTIQAPVKKSFEDSLAEIQDQVPNFNPIQVGSVAGVNRSDVPSVGPINANQFGNVTARNLDAINPNQFTQLSGFGDSYYQNLSDQAARRLQEQYFTKDDSILNQRSNELKRRGVFGDAIGENAINSVYSNFADELAKFQSDLAATKAQNDLELAKYNQGFGLDVLKENRAGEQFNISNALNAALQNRDLQFDVAKENRAGEQFNVSNLLNTILKNKDIETANVDRASEAAFKNQELRNFLTQLGFQAAGDDIRASSDFDTGIFKAEVDAAKANQEARSREAQTWSDIAKDPNYDQEYRSFAKDNINSITRGGPVLDFNEWLAQRQSGDRSGNLSQSRESAPPESPPARNDQLEFRNGVIWRGVVQRGQRPTWVRA